MTGSTFFGCCRHISHRLGSTAIQPLLKHGTGSADSLYSGYGEARPMGTAPSQARIAAEGKSYLRKNFPLLDAIDSARIRDRWLPSQPVQPLGRAQTAVTPVGCPHRGHGAQ